MSASAPPRTGSSLTERIVAIFLLAAGLVLFYVYTEVVPARTPLAPEPFDFKNPMLDAQVGECVVLDATSMQGELICVRVREPGVVVRPRSGPARLGIYRDLHRSRPYLACGLLYPPPGRSCAEADGREEVELFDLNGFGMPYGVDVSLDGITSRWVRKGGRDLFVYEAQLTQYGPASRTWYVSLHPSAPVTGAVLRRHTTERHQMFETLFTAAEDCR